VAGLGCCAVTILALTLSSPASATYYGPPKDAGPPRDIAAVRQAALDAGQSRGWKITRSNVFLVTVQDNFAVAWIGYKGAIGAVLKNVGEL